MDSKSTRHIDLDLDSYNRESRFIKIKGKTIEVFAPDLEGFIKAAKLGKELQAFMQLSEEAQKPAQEGKQQVVITDEDIIKMLDKINNVIKELIPEIAEFKLGIPQMVAIIQLITSMSTPEEIVQLEQKGITPNMTAEKKILSDSVEKLPNLSDFIQPIQSQP